MSKINRHPVRRTAAGVLAGALALSGAVAATTPAYAAAGFSFDRLAGNDRYETSAAIATRYIATAGPAITNVILASGEQGRTPDALAASFLAGVQNAPVLVTRRDTTPEPIMAVLRTLRGQGVTNLTIVGGPVAISETQVTSLRAMGFTTITRLGGANRYETARLIAAAGEGTTASNVGLVASGVSTIDALAGGPLAYKGRHPLFLVTRDGIPGATLRAMRENGITSVYILGGEAVVGPRVVAQLAAAGVTVTGRLAGANRSETSVRIAEALIANFGFTNTTFNLASGLNDGIDALSGAALSGRENRPLLITNNATSATPVVDFARRNAATLNAVGHIFGGETVVSVALANQIIAAGGGSGALGNGVTARPELVGASVVSTTTAAQQSASNLIGTRVRYSFDEAVTGATANPGDFFVTTSAGVRTAATAVTVEAGGLSVLARFAGIETAAGAAALTVATVDDGAVTDGQGNTNPEGDAAIGTGGTTTGGAAGITTAPDLVSVGNFREGAVDGTTAVDFTFDEAAFVTATASFSLIFTDGTQRACTGPAVASTTASGGTSAGGNGTTVITVVCEDVAGGGTTTPQTGTTTIAAASVARGSVAAGSVRDGAATAAATDSDNPLQTVDVSNSGNTTSPDLVSAEFRPGATATTNDAVLFTFDELVQAGTVAANFRVYDSSGNETGSATSAVVNPANALQVLVTFGPTATDNAVGASVVDGAVRAATGAGTAQNLRDEVGVANATQTVTVSGRTTGPDLTGVALSAAGTDAFTGATNAFRAVYTFDEAVSAATPGSFYLFTADGTRLTAGACEVGTAANTGTSTVRCTGFTGTAANGGAITGGAVGNAVLGTVDAAAVTAVDGAPSNPEGAEATSGGTGTPNSAPTAGPGAPAAQALTVTAPSAPAAGATTVTFTANRALNAASVTAADIAVTGGASQPTPASVTASGSTITVTFASPGLVAGNIVTLASGSVNDAGGAAGPASAVATPATTAAPAAAAPTASGTTTETGTADNVLQAGEAFVITFSAPINPAGVNTSAATLTVRDVDGTTATFACGADCVLSSNNTVLTIPNGALPTGTGGTAGFQGPLTVTATQGFVAATGGAAVTVPFNIAV